MKIRVERAESARPRVDAVRLARLPALLLRAARRRAPDHRRGGLVARRRRRLPAAVLRGIPLARHARQLVIAWAIHGIGLAIVPINPAGVCFFIYAAAFLGFACPPRAAFGWLALMLVSMTAQALLARHRRAGAGCRRWSIGRRSSARTNIQLRRDAAQGSPPARRPGGGRGDGAHRRARAHRPRPARSARAHAVGHRAQVGAGVEARRSRPGARGRRDPRRRAHLARGARRSAQGGQRLSRRAG